MLVSVSFTFHILCLSRNNFLLTPLCIQNFLITFDLLLNSSIEYLTLTLYLPIHTCIFQGEICSHKIQLPNFFVEVLQNVSFKPQKFGGSFSSKSITFSIVSSFLILRSTSGSLLAFTNFWITFSKDGYF